MGNSFFRVFMVKLPYPERENHCTVRHVQPATRALGTGIVLTERSGYLPTTRYLRDDGTPLSLSSYAFG